MQRVYFWAAATVIEFHCRGFAVLCVLDVEQKNSLLWSASCQRCEGHMLDWDRSMVVRRFTVVST